MNGQKSGAGDYFFYKEETSGEDSDYARSADNVRNDFEAFRLDMFGFFGVIEDIDGVADLH